MKPANGNSQVILFLFSWLLISGCGEKKTPREVLVKTYVENLITEETYSFNSDSLRLHRQNIFAKNNITQNDFETELKAMQSDPDAWDAFFQRSNKLLDSLKQAGRIK